MQYETCHHVHPNGAYCGSPSLRDHNYCYYHLEERRRRLRRARALRDNVPYRLDIPSLDSPYAVRNAISEIAQAISAGQLEPLAAGKLLYAVQLAAANNRRIEQMEAKAAKEAVASQSDATSRIQEYPDFEKQFGIPPGADLDAETDAVFQKADEEAQYRQSESFPVLPPGVRPGSVAYRVFREEAYQMLRHEVLGLRHELRDYHEQKREKLKKELMAEFPALYSKESPGGIQGVVKEDTSAKKPPTSLASELKEKEATETA
jgi:hypothetical protein